VARVTQTVSSIIQTTIAIVVTGIISIVMELIGTSALIGKNSERRSS
jgi:hypothetical protein